MIDNPRLELVLAEHGRTIAIGLIAIGVLALVATGWVVATPSTSTTVQYGDERVSSDVETSAVVVQDGALWSEGDRLENSGVYMLEDSPELTLEPTTELQNTSDRTPIDDGVVDHELTLRFEATRDDSVFWNETHTLIDGSPTVEDGAATSETTIDVDAYRDRQQELESALSGVGAVDLRLEFRAEYDTGTTEGVHTASSPLEVTDDAYWLEESLSATDENTVQTGTEETTEPRNLTAIAALSLLGTLAIAGGVFAARRSPIDEAAARRAVHERRYAEWISRGSIPMWIGDYHVSLDTIEDVVDVAIDTNERVVHDTQRGLFAVVSDGVVYYYSDRGLWEETAWPEMDLEDQSAVADAEPPITPDDLELEGSDEFADPEDGFDDDEDVWQQL
ncbi:DUF5305 domain-containing protein [Natronolimnohabitans innermongolicus]|uniref:DUF5305 domain-containing protein n=1 Tax=Natronolimnohabitans innermongolicus JCM 12255 TaxID=1227499 RepID=L9WX19_9EURY|nr:DUF5305 domain-containing protein [Natronolimnohabitans innermongolicus]ELY54004.1 hypothetical protein C493_13178 [Natronolimnohabitans innermongolicus JCM 12255]